LTDAERLGSINDHRLPIDVPVQPKTEMPARVAKAGTELPSELMRARRTAAAVRAALATCGIAAAILGTDSPQRELLVCAGFGVIFVTSFVQLLVPRVDWLKLEESLAPLAAVLIIGLGPQQVSAISMLWLAAVASGVLARGGRVFWVGPALLLISLGLPILRLQEITLGYGCQCVAVLALSLVCGRVTRELRQMLERARYDADHDSLTGALSRAAFRSRLDRFAASVTADDRAALMLVDLNNFGAVNKTAGHAAGDAALRSVAERIRAASGADGVLGRLGGDEFAAIVIAPDPTAVAQRLLDDLGDGRHGAHALAASIGMALIPRDGDDAESLLRAVDVALRVAKRTGKHQLSVYAGESMSDRGPGGAREALERLIAGEGLAMAVQPIVAVPSRAIHAYEALARFQTGGSPNPLHWFALADEFGVRDRLEFACLRAGLDLLKARPEGTWLSINLSGPLLLDPRTRELLEAVGELGGLILELTENSLLEDTYGLNAEISRLRGLGVKFAVDDMGAGYSGLRQITTVRPAYLKLDRSLITGIDHDPDRGALVSAMLGYVRETGGHLVAEGVETEAELETLIHLGVKLVQGYRLARPGWPWPEVAAADRPSAPSRPLRSSAVVAVADLAPAPGAGGAAGRALHDAQA
jgi:diguanylate cyclase (GGDEF)-like protein